MRSEYLILISLEFDLNLHELKEIIDYRGSDGKVAHPSEITGAELNYASYHKEARSMSEVYRRYKALENAYGKYFKTYEDGLIPLKLN